jgi:hypothetical protein
MVLTNNPDADLGAAADVQVQLGAHRSRAVEGECKEVLAAALYNLPTAQRDVLNACEVGPNRTSSVSNDCDLLSRSSFPTYPWCAPLLPPTHPVDARRTVCTSSVRRAHTPAARQELPGVRRDCVSPVCAVSVSRAQYPPIHVPLCIHATLYTQ